MISFEFFPPKTPEGMQKLHAAQQQLAVFNPKYYSVTFGAGGSTRDKTLETVLSLKQNGADAAPHISCISSTRAEIADLLDAYKVNNIKHLVALRGDIPSGEVSVGDFRYANELVSFIRDHSSDWFHIEVAAYPEFHPEAKSAGADLNNFKRKVDAGADSAITQYFYTPEAYFHFVDQCQWLGIDIPIVPGIMPIYNYAQLARFSSVCGADIPRWLRLRLENYGEDVASIREFGVEVVSRLCEDLLKGGAPGLHFYTLNQAGIISRIVKNLSLATDKIG